MDDTDLNVHSVYKIGTRTALIMGCERNLLIMTITLAITVGFSLQSLLGIVLAVGFFVFMLGILRKMAKVDPFLSQIYIRHIHFKKSYLAHATHFGITNKIYK